MKVAKNMVKMALKWPKIAHFSKFDKFTILADFHDLSTKKVMYESFEPESKILDIFRPDQPKNRDFGPQLVKFPHFAKC